VGGWEEGGGELAVQIYHKEKQNQVIAYLGKDFL